MLIDHLNKNIDPSWKTLFADLQIQCSLNKLEAKLSTLQDTNTKIYPTKENIFNAFKYTKLGDVKVVILGQDPYHGANQAHGLAFSVPMDKKIPPSLRNIFQEMHDDLNLKHLPDHGNLSAWTKQGVLLLNTVLTVEAEKAGSHRNIGWEDMTSKIIEMLSQSKRNLVFILWGKDAQTKTALIDQKKHHIITSPHPSPLSAYRGFFGSKPFSKTNTYLQSKKISPIDWSL